MKQLIMKYPFICSLTFLLLVLVSCQKGDEPQPFSQQSENQVYSTARDGGEGDSDSTDVSSANSGLDDPIDPVDDDVIGGDDNEDDDDLDSGVGVDVGVGVGIVKGKGESGDLNSGVGG